LFAVSTNRRTRLGIRCREPECLVRNRFDTRDAGRAADRVQCFQIGRRDFLRLDDEIDDHTLTRYAAALLVAAGAGINSRKIAFISLTRSRMLAMGFSIRSLSCPASL